MHAIFRIIRTETVYDYSILPWGQNSAKFSEIKGIIRSGRSMRRQYKGQMKQTKRSKSDLRNSVGLQFAGLTLDIIGTNDLEFYYMFLEKLCSFHRCILKPFIWTS
jgi:hypothetical protein